MDRRAWQATGHEFTKSWTGLNDFHFHCLALNISYKHCIAIFLLFKIFVYHLHIFWIPDWVVKLLSCVQLFAKPWTAAYQTSPSMGFSRQEYWSGLPFPSPGDLPDPGIELGFPSLEADALTSEPPEKPQIRCSEPWHVSRLPPLQKYISIWNHYYKKSKIKTQNSPKQVIKKKFEIICTSVLLWSKHKFCNFFCWQIWYFQTIKAVSLKFCMFENAKLSPFFPRCL